MSIYGHKKIGLPISGIVGDIHKLMDQHDLDEIVLEILDSLVPGQQDRILPMDQAMEYGTMLRAIRSGIELRLENRSWWSGKFSKP